MGSIYVVSPTVALVVSVVLQVLKNSPYCPWLTRETGKINAIVSFLVAFVTSVGIVSTFDFDRETGRFAAGFSGNLLDIGHAVGHGLVQWAEQHVWYKGLLVPSETLGEIRAILKTMAGESPRPKP